MKDIEPIKYCENKSLNLTPLRKQVLDILIEQTYPLTAYEILDILKKNIPNSQAMSVYRVLTFLQENGLIHRIENLNAFIICKHLSKKHSSQWLICKQCGLTQECIANEFNKGISNIEKETGFNVTIPTIELIGICQNCQN